MKKNIDIILVVLVMITISVAIATTTYLRDQVKEYTTEVAQ